VERSRSYSSFEIGHLIEPRGEGESQRKEEKTRAGRFKVKIREGSKTSGGGVPLFMLFLGNETSGLKKVRKGRREKGNYKKGGNERKCSLPRSGRKVGGSSFPSETLLVGRRREQKKKKGTRG